jgi:3-phosphoshikimate 1-carboxyvinyltransferase
MVQLGARISVSDLEEHHGELVGIVQVQGGTLKGLTIAGADTASLIDEIPVLAAIGPFTTNGIEVRDARELRVKESDRIAVVAANLRQMGAHVEEREDGLRIPGGQSLHAAQVNSHGDHRIAMAFAIAGLCSEVGIAIDDAACVEISFPSFFDLLRKICLH